MSDQLKSLGLPSDWGSSSLDLAPGLLRQMKYTVRICLHQSPQDFAKPVIGATLESGCIISLVDYVAKRDEWVVLAAPTDRSDSKEATGPACLVDISTALIIRCSNPLVTSVDYELAQKYGSAYYTSVWDSLPKIPPDPVSPSSAKVKLLTASFQVGDIVLVRDHDTLLTAHGVVTQVPVSEPPSSSDWCYMYNYKVYVKDLGEFTFAASMLKFVKRMGGTYIAPREVSQ